MTINPAVSILTAWGSIFLLSLGRNVLDGFLGRLFGGRPVQAIGFILAVVLAIVLGGDWLLMRFGRTVTARVERKDELIDVGRDGAWTRTLTVEASYRPRGWSSAATVYLPVGAPVHDLVRRGQEIPIRCLPLVPTFCLLKYDSLRSWMVRTIGNGLAGAQGLFLLGLPIVLLAAGNAGAGRAPWRWWVGTGLFLVWAAVLVWRVTGAEPASPAVAAHAAVRVRQVDFRSEVGLVSPYLHLHLPVPSAIVQLAVPVAGHDTVIAVDQLDSAAVAGVRPGAAFLASHDRGDARSVRLDGGRRTFQRANRSREVAVALGLIALMALPLAVAGVQRHQDPRPGGPAPAGP